MSNYVNIIRIFILYIGDNLKILCVNKNTYKVYINNNYYLYDKNTINNFISKILLILKKRYNVELYSIFNIKCYIDNSYGIIFEITREYDPFTLYLKKTDIKIIYYNNSKFLYSIDDYFITNKSKKYIYQKKYYLDSNSIDTCEHTNDIVYGNIVKKIIDNNV